MEYKVVQKKYKCISTWLTNVFGNIHFSKWEIYITHKEELQVIITVNTS